MAFVNLPLRYIAEQPHYLDLFLTRKFSPEPGLDAQALAWLENRKAAVSITFEPHTEEDFLATEAYLQNKTGLLP